MASRRKVGKSRIGPDALRTLKLRKDLAQADLAPRPTVAEPSMLCYGDNLLILRDRDYFPSESIDLSFSRVPCGPHLEGGPLNQQTLARPPGLCGPGAEIAFK